LRVTRLLASEVATQHKGVLLRHHPAVLGQPDVDGYLEREYPLHRMPDSADGPRMGCHHTVGVAVQEAATTSP
jgi:hypothetical protein